jgi:hypothetical protein
MGLMIEDGTGSGNQAQVKGNKLLVSGIVSSQEHYANHALGQGFNAIISATPTGAGDYFFYLKNENSDTTMSVEGIWLKMEADDYIEIEIGDTGSPIGGTDITPVNANSASGNQALGIFQQGSDLTGLNGGSVFHKIYHASSTGSMWLNFNMDIVIAPNGVLTLKAGTGTVPIEAVMVMTYHGTNN